LYEIADGSCGQSDLNCDYVKYAKAAEKALADGTCADQGYTVQTGTQTKSYPVIGDIVITTYSKGAEETSSCSGTADPAGPACYEGSAGALGLTETVKVNLQEVSAGAGKLEFTGSGIEGFTCSDKTFTKSGSDVSLSDLSDCLPDHVEVTKVQYCSDDDTMKVTVKDDTVPLPVSASLKNVPCAGREVFATCTGDADPVITGATCYKGSAGALGLTETVTVKINDFGNGAGHVDFSGEGIESFTCAGKTFTKSGQDITFSDSSDCLPSGIVVSGVKYCSDSDTMKITVKDTAVPLPISAIMSKIDCPSSVEI
jgi:archaellum component FlaF (FlaF/FlaG flagellin family)